jgi:DNA-binding NarL/FixJ family response regulator
LSERMAGLMMQKMFCSRTEQPGSTLGALADRELEVFQMIGRGLGTRQIAQNLGVGIKTVETYKARIKEKLGLSGGTELQQHAIQWAQSEQRE